MDGSWGVITYDADKNDRSQTNGERQKKIVGWALEL